MTIGDRIAALRKEKRMTLEELADACGATRQTVFKYEKGMITNIPSDKLELIADKLHTTPAYLMGWESTKQTGLNLEGYESLNAENRAMVDRMIAQLLKAQSAD